MKAIMAEIDKLFDRASDLAVQAVVNEAREILKADDGLHEFIMAMGGCFFTIKDGGKYDALNTMDDDEYDDWCESDEYVNVHHGIIDNVATDFQQEFFDNVDDLNEKFNVMGYPTRFTATSKEVHEWGDTMKDPVVYEDK